jgi:DNA polymerase-1
VTAQKLLREFGSLESLYANLAVVTGPKLREALARHRDQAFLSRQLAVLEGTLPLEFDVEQFRVREPEWERLRALWTELEFTTLLRQIPARTVTLPAGTVPVVDGAGWREFLDRAGARIAVEPVLTGNLPDLTLHGLAAYAPGAGACYLMGRPTLPPGVRLVGHDTKALVTWARGAAVDTGGELGDTAIAAYLLNSARSGYPLDQLCADVGSPGIPGALASLLDGAPVTEADPAKVAAWTGARAEGVWRLAEAQAPLLADHGLHGLYETLEVPLVPVLADMERVGIRVDPERLAQLTKELDTQLDALLREIHQLAAEPVNPNSPKQLATVLFEKL